MRTRTDTQGSLSMLTQPAKRNLPMQLYHATLQEGRGTHSANRERSNICSAVPMFTTVNAWMMAIAQKISTISQPKKTSQMTLAMQVNG